LVQWRVRGAATIVLASIEETSPMSIRHALSIAIGAALLAACAGGGMYDQPYALFQPDQRSVPQDTRPAFVLSVDGVSRAISDNNPVAPGMRKIQVSVPGARGMSESTYQTFEIDAKPCTRYYLAARHSSPAADDWSVFVSGTEPIGECQKKFASTAK